ncbi:MAG: DUF1304 domain-containing protein [Pseudobdellovibrionaceae bacterium]
MNQLIFSLTLVVSLQHWFFLILECFLWNKPLGMRVFRMSKERANSTATLAMNQGVYNGFLSVGLLCCAMLPDQFGPSVLVFFHACVVTAAVVGAATISKKVLFIQGAPAALALAAIYFA